MALAVPTNSASAQANNTAVDVALSSNVTSGNTLIVLVTGYDTGAYGTGAITKQAGTATIGTVTRHVSATNGVLALAVFSAPITGS